MQPIRPGRPSWVISNVLSTGFHLIAQRGLTFSSGVQRPSRQIEAFESHWALTDSFALVEQWAHRISMSKCLLQNAFW